MRRSSARPIDRSRSPASLFPACTADFGFVHILWVYSGRRGIHAWISDTAALNLTDEQRSAIVRYIDIVKGYTAMDKRLTTTKPLHPSVRYVSQERVSVRKKASIADYSPAPAQARVRRVAQGRVPERRAQRPGRVPHRPEAVGERPLHAPGPA